jgi:hypothetical protein
VLAASYRRLPARMALQIGGDGALIGTGPRHYLWLAPVTGRSPDARRLGWMYRAFLPLVFLYVAALVWAAYGATHPR